MTNAEKLDENSTWCDFYPSARHDAYQLPQQPQHRSGCGDIEHPGARNSASSRCNARHSLAGEHIAELEFSHIRRSSSSSRPPPRARGPSELSKRCVPIRLLSSTPAPFNPFLAITLLVLLTPCSVLAQPCSPLPAVNDVVAELGISGTVTDPDMMLNGVPVEGHQTIYAMPNGAQRERLTAIVGSELKLNISASWGEPFQEHNITLFAYEDPGIPNGAQLAGQECLGAGGICNPVLRRLVWRPTKLQEGITHSLCFTGMTANGEAPVCSAEYKCIDVHVTAPNVTFDAEESPAPLQQYHAPVGCNLEICFQARDTHSMYEVDLQPQTSSFPPGATFDLECFHPPAPPAVHPLFASASLSEPIAHATLPCRRCLHWAAPAGSETQQFEPCVMAVDQRGLRSVQRCVHITVPKCKYCVQGGDTLHSINKRFGLGTSWLQLWNSNGMPEIDPHPLSPATPFGDPDAISNGYSVINLGPQYRVKEGESLLALAALFRTTLGKLLLLNPELQDPSHVHVGQLICVMPCSDPLLAAGTV